MKPGIVPAEVKGPLVRFNFSAGVGVWGRGAP